MPRLGSAAAITLPCGMILAPDFWCGPSGRPEPRGDDFSDLFLPAPRWGLRGDPIIWWVLREDLTGTAIPATADAMAALLDARFDHITQGGQSQDETLSLPVIAGLSPGMSGGVISLVWWRETGRRTLIDRGAAFQTRFDPLDQRR